MWEPIENLPEAWKSLQQDDLIALGDVWGSQKQRLQASNAYQTFMDRLRREIAIETGIIERLYTIDHGITLLLIERGIDESLIQHGTTNKPAAQVVAYIRDHADALQRVFDFVGGQRDLSTSFIKQLHQLLTRNQSHTEAIDQFGHHFQTELIKGDWKKQPNNPKRPDGTIHEYCPPEQVASQMDQLMAWHHEHLAEGVSAEVEAAWLHHRFTQIHPFQDGNGRVARLLATLVLIRAGWFPLVINTKDDPNARAKYIQALEQADAGNILPLVLLIASAQKRAFQSAFSLSEDLITAAPTYDNTLQAVVNKLATRKIRTLEEAVQLAEVRATQLYHVGLQRLGDVRRDIELELSSIPDLAVTLSLESADADDERSVWYRHQIVNTAKQLHYYANLSGYKAWVRLSVQAETSQTELLLSYHVVGQEIKGVMAISACGYRRDVSPDAETRFIVELEPMNQDAFIFTYQEEPQAIEERFRKWLEEVIPLWLFYWQKGL